MIVLLRLYRRLFRLLPEPLRSRYEADVRATVAATLAEAAQRGWWRLLQRFTHEVRDLLVTAVRVRVWQHRQLERRRGVLAGWLDEARLSGRSLSRSRSFLASAVLTLGVGAGCAAAGFAVLDALLLRPLPHPSSDRLVMVWQRIPSAELERGPMSYPTLLDLRAATDVLTGLEAYSGGAQALALAGGEPERVTGVRVTGGLLGLIGNRPLVGRVLLPADDDPGAEPVVVISHALWQRQFGGREDALGGTLQIRSLPHRIVGVMPSGFVFPSLRAEFWSPLRLDAAQAERDLNFLTPMARLRDGVDITTAAQALSARYAHLRAQYPDAYRDQSVHVEERRTYLVGDAARLAWIGAGAAALLLLVGCINLLNLMLVRGVTREHELSVRAALGAGRVRVAASLLTEGLWIGVGAALVALLLGRALIDLVVRFGPADLPRSNEIVLGGRALIVTIGLAVTCAVACALLPALRRSHPARAFQTRGSTLDRRGRALQSGFVVGQVSLAFVLLVAALLLTSTLNRLLSVPVGFAGERVLTAQLALPAADYPDRERIAQFYDRLFARLRSQPGVEQVGGTWALPFSDDYASSTMVPADAPNTEPVLVSTAPVRGDYFAALGMRLLRGRNFTESDDAAAEPVVLVNETLARRFWPGRDPIGQWLRDPDDAADRVRVVGVVNDVKRRELAAETQPEMYQPHAQAGWSGGSLYLTIRTAGAPQHAIGALRAEVRALDARLPVSQLGTLQERVSSSVATPRFRAAVLSAFAVAAALITLLGIAAVQAVQAASQRRDVAIRLALGARSAEVTRRFARRGVRLTFIGLVIGCAAAALGTRVLQSALFGVSPLDPRTYLLAAASFLAAGAIASYLPVRSVGRLEPMRVLREE